MKNTIYLLAIISLAIIIPACGGKTETKENETKQTSTTVSSTSVPAGNSFNPPTKQTDGDADNVRKTDTNSALRSNTDGQVKKDADDLRQGNTNQRKTDLDDRKGNRPVNSRRDADDFGKRDSDGDADDN
jgi:hypothetical protein